MKKLVLLAILAPAVAAAQVQASASFRLDLPVIIPPLVVIEPGIRVIPDVDFEVFHVDGYYWTRRNGVWFRSSNPREGWVRHPHGYPPGLAKLKPGKYKRWKPGPAVRAGDRYDRDEPRGRDHDRGGHGGGKGGRGKGERKHRD